MLILKFEVDHDGIAIISMDLPDRPMNVTTPELTRDLMQAFERVASSPDIKGAILTSGKKNCFVAGGDIKDFANAYDRGMTRAQAFELSRESSDFFRRIETCGKPIAAAINGLALGGGMELCLACHYRVIVDDPKAILGQPEVTIGILPGGGATQRLPRLIGIEKALPLLLSGRHVGPEEALQLGLVHAVVPATELIATAKRWLLENPQAQQPWDMKGYTVPGHAPQSFMTGTARAVKETSRNYPAPLAILSCVVEGIPVSIEEGLRIESKYFATLLTGPVARNLMRTTFVNKGLIKKLAHRPVGIPKTTIKKLGIAGVGVAQARLAFAAAEAGIDVVLLDADRHRTEESGRTMPEMASKNTGRANIAGGTAGTLLGRISTRESDDALDDCDLVVEVRAPATLQIDPHAPPVFRRDDVIGIHFSSLTGQMPLMEILVEERSSQRLVAHAFDLAGQLKKTPIALHGNSGCHIDRVYTDRVITAYIDEGMCLLEEGAAPALIENAATMAGMACGPLGVADDMSIGTHWNTIRPAIEDGQENSARCISAYHVSKRMVQHFIRLGRDAGAGFYNYPEQAKKFLWPGLKDVFKVAQQQPDVEQIKKRLLYIQALEAARCVEEGMIRHAADADVSAVLGWGFPTYTGGPLSLIDTAGIIQFVAECESMAQLYGPRFQPSPWLITRATHGQNFYGVHDAAR